MTEIDNLTPEVRAFLLFAGELEFRAFEARSFEASWRGFKVGAAVLMMNQNGDYRIFVAGNIKRNGHKKVCAERLALKRAHRAGYKRFIAVCVIGNLQPDNETGVMYDTLHPCEVCIPALLRARGSDPHDPIIRLVNPHDPSKREEYSLWQLVVLHETAKKEKRAKEEAGGASDTPP